MKIKAGLGLKRRAFTTSSSSLDRAVSQHTDMNKNTKPLQFWCVFECVLQHEDQGGFGTEKEGLYHLKFFLGSGCVTTHWHEQEHQASPVLMCLWMCSAAWRSRRIWDWKGGPLPPQVLPWIGLCHNTLTWTRTPSLSSSDVSLNVFCSMKIKAGLGLKRRAFTTSSSSLDQAVSQHTDMNKNTKPLQFWCVFECVLQHEDQGGFGTEKEGLYHLKFFLGSGCVTTHWHEQEHQASPVLMCLWMCSAAWRSRRVWDWKGGPLPPQFLPWIGLCHNTLTWTRTPSLSSSDVSLNVFCSIKIKAGLGLKRRAFTTSSSSLAQAVSQHTDMNKNTKPLQFWCVFECVLQHKDQGGFGTEKEGLYHLKFFLGSGCVTTHWHEQEHQASPVLMCLWMCSAA